MGVMCMDNMKLWYLSKRRAARAKGAPPLTFESNGQPVTNWSIAGVQGGVGDKTENLFDAASNDVQISTSIDGSGAPHSSQWFDLYTVAISPNEKYTVYGQPNTSGYEYHCFYNANGQVVGVFKTSGTTQTGTAPSTAVSLKLNIMKTAKQNVMLIARTFVPSDYIPYGYKIPLTCGGETTPVYLDSPLGENEIITGAETGVAVPTVSGTNVLTVGTAVQPTCVSVSAEPEMPTPLERYLYSKFIINDE